MFELAGQPRMDMVIVVDRSTLTGAAATLAGWPLHATAWVSGFREPENADEEHAIRRLLEIGFLPGEPVRLMACGLPGADPLAVRVGHSTFALRRHEAALVTVTAQGPVA